MCLVNNNLDLALVHVAEQQRLSGGVGAEQSLSERNTHARTRSETCIQHAAIVPVFVSPSSAHSAASFACCLTHLTLVCLEDEVGILEQESVAERGLHREQLDVDGLRGSLLEGEQLAHVLREGGLHAGLVSPVDLSPDLLLAAGNTQRAHSSNSDRDRRSGANNTGQMECRTDHPHSKIPPRISGRASRIDRCRVPAICAALFRCVLLVRAVCRTVVSGFPVLSTRGVAILFYGLFVVGVEQHEKLSTAAQDKERRGRSSSGGRHRADRTSHTQSAPTSHIDQ